MLKSHRAWILALGLALSLCAVPGRAADVDPYLPNDTEAVVTVNVKQILESGFVKKYGIDAIKDALKDDNAQQLMKDLDFDPLKHVDLIVSSASGGEKERGLLIVHGRFDVAKFEAKAEALAKDQPNTFKLVKATGDGGREYKLYEVAKTPGLDGQKLVLKDKPGYVALLDKGTMVASPQKELVIEALDKAAGKKKTAVKSKELLSLIEKSDAKQSVWVAALHDVLARNVPGGDDGLVKEKIDKVATLSGGVTIEKEIKLELVLAANSADDADDLRETINDTVQTGVGVLGILAGKNKSLLPLIDILKTIKAGGTDKAVTINGQITGDVMEKALKTLPKNLKDLKLPVGK
jgi:hypothetical protein